MKKHLLSISFLIALSTTLSAQIVREEADKIVWEYIQNELSQPCLLYAIDN